MSEVILLLAALDCRGHTTCVVLHCPLATHEQGILTGQYAPCKIQTKCRGRASAH